MKRAALLLLLVPTLAFAAPAAPRVDPAVEAAFQRADRQLVIVEVQDPFGSDRAPGCDSESSVDELREVRRRQREADLAARKAKVLASLPEPRVRYEYPSFRLMALDVDRFDVEVLAAHPDVVHVHFDERHEAALTSSLPYTRVSAFHNGSPAARGGGTSVAVLDTPVRYSNGSFGTCPSVGASGCSVAVLQNFTSDDLTFVANKSGHGTNVAGIVLGMAPETKILSLNVFHWDETQQKVFSNSSAQVAALNWIAQNAATYNIVSANLSIGGDRTDSGPCNSSSLYDPVRTLYKDHKVLVAIASGNESQPNSVASPGCLTLAVTVGAQFDTDLSSSCTSPYAGQIACFSNLNGALDLVAPGVNVTAGGLYNYSGTSMATPHVAGAIATWQSSAKASGGSFIDPFWLHRYLQLHAIPLPHGTRRYQQLNMDQQLGPRWDRAASFPWYYRPYSVPIIDPGSSIPGPGSSHTQTLSQSGNGWNVGSAYLHLEVVHPSPQDLEVTVTGPTGKQVAMRLPSGQANFNGVIGRMVLPGALAGLAGSPVDGTWKLAIRDTVSSGRGDYISGTLFWIRQGCTATCSDANCGDNRCGGDCGTCFIGNKCIAGGTANPSNACQACLPGASATGWSNDDSRACSDKNACTQTDTCRAGACVGSNPYVCPPPTDTCRVAGSCSPSTGQCIYPILGDGKACDDGNACTRTDTCRSGKCTGANPVACAAQDQCHLAGTCDTLTGACSNPVAPDGKACSDGDACTRTDTCVAGVCAGASPVVCAALDQCHEVGACEPSTGVCSNPAKADGIGCDDGNACTRVDACVAGACSGAQPIECVALDQCHEAGTCDPATGVCSDPAKADGAACDDADGCTQVDACLAGACVGSQPVACEDPGQCKAVRCDSATGGCVVSNLANGTACDDGDACTKDDACRAGACGGDPIVCGGEECQPGACDPVSGACASKAAADGTPCADGACQGGACVALAGPDAGVGPEQPAGTASEAQSCGCSSTTGSPGMALVPALLVLALRRRRLAGAARHRD